MLNLKNFKFSKFFSDLGLNYLSLVFLGLSGILLNIIIARNYGTSTLGVFNQILSIYIIFPMISSAGIPHSVLHYLPKFNSKSSEVKTIISTALVLVTILSAILIFLFLYLIIPISVLLDSQEIIIGLKLILPAIFFFSINKVLIYGVINGLREMKRFAIFQSSRYLLILLCLIIFSIFKPDESFLPLVFTFSEFILFLIIVIDLSKNLKFWKIEKNFFYWIKKHLIFGAKSIFNGLLIEINSRIDILMVGIYLSDNEVGIYSIAALFAEGFLQIFIVIQNNVNPIISRYFSSKRINNLSLYLSKLKKLTYKISILLCMISIFLYKPILDLIIPNYLVSSSFVPFMILTLGITMASGFIPFGNILSMAGLPELNTIYMVSFVSFNIILNFILIPIYGINGAALATSSSYIFAAVFLFTLTKFYLKIRL